MRKPPALGTTAVSILGVNDGTHPPKMFEYNCDTPTSMLETAVIQWEWKEAVFPKENYRPPNLKDWLFGRVPPRQPDQFNSLHDKLLAKWKDIAPYLKSRSVHFTHVNDDAGEDSLTVTAYLRDLCRTVLGMQTTGIPSAKDFGLGFLFAALRRSRQPPCGRPVSFPPGVVFVNEQFGPHIVDSYDQDELDRTHLER